MYVYVLQHVLVMRLVHGLLPTVVMNAMSALVNVIVDITS